MDSETKVIINPDEFVLPNLVREKIPYPSLDQVLGDISAAAKEVVVVDGPGVLREVGEVRALNIFMLGALMGLKWIPIDDSILWAAVARRCSKRYLDVNRMAFDIGRTSVGDRATG
jgi:Pyruvate/2-oxoacid:ferredoxin oxidoreductase gamma subunit